MTNSYSETADIETSSENYASRFSGDVGKWFLSIQESIVVSLIKETQAKTILDVGGGHGQLARPLSMHGFNITVLGSSSTCPKSLSDLIASNQCSYICGDIVNLPFEDKSFDAVVSVRLLPHCTQWQRLISELCRVSRNQVIVDYPPLFSSNLLYKILFPVKLALEGNTRTFTIFKDSEVIAEFEKAAFRKHKILPQFFLPMVLHRKLKNVKLSSTLEGIFRSLYLTQLFGSPTILSCKR